MSIFIDTPIQFLKGVGPKLGDVFRKRGIETAGDLLEWYPRGYEDRRAVRDISSLQPGEVVSITGRVLSVRSVNMGRSRRKMYEVIVGDASGRIGCKYFRVPYKGYFERFQPHQEVRVAGKVINYRGRIEFHHPDLHPARDDDEHKDALLPLYTETEGLSPTKLRKIIATAIDHLIDHPQAPQRDAHGFIRDVPKGIPDDLPRWVRDKYRLLTRAQALRDIHCPSLDQGTPLLEMKAQCQRRLIFEEFFWLELLLASRRSGVRKEKGFAMPGENKFYQQITEGLPFALTGAQKRSYEQILADLKRATPMHRLVQGDVGSGKTLVALLSAAHAASHGFQTSIMVPTEILAEQHYKNAQKIFEPLGIKVGLLTGSLKASGRREVLADVESGEIAICIGTHALIQDEVNFKNLGLVIVDEQHRFGVDQRNKLKQKGGSPHFLVMTATPIPRTLAMTVYGDLDVSIIDEMPKGRSPVVTRKAFENKRSAVFQFVGEQLEKGRQAYVVYPLVEESEKIDLKDAISQYEKIVSLFPQYRVGLLHGKMKSVEKDAVMADFRDQKIDILVATTVIEVGVDVPNANIMVVEHAERFGLSQLHQLRGRVGRGAHKSFCVLMLGYAVSEDGRARADIMEQTTDGFKIAEADLEMRGPGEFLGRRQSGLPGFKLANLVRDVQILQEAREAAFQLMAQDPELREHDHGPVKYRLKEHRDNVIG